MRKGQQTDCHNRVRFKILRDDITEQRIRTKKIWERYGLTVRGVNHAEFIIGMVLVLLSLVMPLFFNIKNMRVHVHLHEAMWNYEKTELMVAALSLVMLNAIRSIPHYVGSFFIGESINIYRGKRPFWIINGCLIILILRIIYAGINSIYGIQYDFGIPAMMAFAFVLLFRNMNYQYVSLLKKAVLITLVLTALQFMDVMPTMNHLSVGRGETSQDIKLAAMILGGETLLDVTGTVGMALFLLFGTLIFFHLRAENDLRQLNYLREQNELIRMQSQISEMQNRIYREMQYLVHDLKSPLTALQTLVGVLKMKCEMEEREQDIDYLNRIESAAGQMSCMISEILYEDKMSAVSTNWLYKTVLAQISVADYSGIITSENQAPDEFIRANQVLFPRVIINLLQNSAKAVKEKEKPDIRFTIREEGEYIVFSVEDNGVGISMEMQDDIWTHGISDTESSGLGLAFVKKIVEKMQGKIELTSSPGTGTTIKIVIQKELKNEKTGHDIID